MEFKIYDSYDTKPNFTLSFVNKENVFVLLWQVEKKKEEIIENNKSHKGLMHFSIMVLECMYDAKH